MKKAVLGLVVVAVLTGWMFWPRQGLTHVTSTNTVLFEREIVRILEEHCIACHASEGPALRLVTYEETWLNRKPILDAVLARHMPPWAAVPGFGDFTNDNGLTLRETQFIISWVEGLGPRNAGEVFLNVGDRSEVLGAVEASVDLEQWGLGEPSLIRTLDAKVIDAQEGEHVERILIDLGLTSERQVRGIEFQPGDRRVVRAATFFLEETNKWLGSWTPWHGFTALPEGVAYNLAPGARVIAEISYGTSEERVVDEGRLGLFFHDEPAGSAITSSDDLVLEARGEVAPFTRWERFGAETQIDEDTHLLALLPQLDPGIQSIEVSVRHPDGGTRILLFAKDIPLEWPTPYILRDPVLVPQGSRLLATAYAENHSETAQLSGFTLRLSRY